MPEQFKIEMGTPQPITERTFAFAVRIVKLCQVLDESPGVARTMSLNNSKFKIQKWDENTGANVEESQAAQSSADFVHKLEIALKEARETQYWLKLLIATEIMPEQRLLPLLNETQEIIKVIASIVVSKKRNQTS